MITTFSLDQSTMCNLNYKHKHVFQALHLLILRPFLFLVSPHVDLIIQQLSLYNHFLYLGGFTTSSFLEPSFSNSFPKSLHSSLGVFYVLPLSIERANLSALLRSSSHFLTLIFFFSSSKALIHCALTLIFNSS